MMAATVMKIMTALAAPTPIWSRPNVCRYMNVAGSCVEFPGPFDRVNTAGTTCTADNLKQFTSELVPSTTGTFTYTLR